MPDNKTINGSQSTDEKMQELFDLLNERPRPGSWTNLPSFPRRKWTTAP